MAVTQYIGARYVPIFANPVQWTNDRAYEPLTIVMYQGASYTSRQAVPIGVEITNEDFWVLSGNYNAQVEQYRQEVVEVSNRIDGIDSEIDDVNEHIDSEIDDVNDRIDSEIATVNQHITDVEEKTPVYVESYGAVGDGVTDCTAAIQNAIDENPLSTVTFKGGVYIITDTIFLNGDFDSVNLDLNGATIKWAGRNTVWAEYDPQTLTPNPFTLIPNTAGITSNPSVMIAVSRRKSNFDLSASRTLICNGNIDCDHKADIAIQNVTYATIFENLRIFNFQYVGILNGTLDGKSYTYNGTVSSDSGKSTQAFISDCYFVRGSDMSARKNVSAIMITYPDNQIDNCVTNRTDIGITLRVGGNSVSNCHFTTQYVSQPQASLYDGTACRIWVFNAASTQINLFDNCYFNAMKYVFRTFVDSTQSYTGMSLRTVCSNSHYTFYNSTQFGDESIYGQSGVGMLDAYWFGGSAYGSIQTIDCAFLYGDWLNMHMNAPRNRPSLTIARTCETKVANIIPPHEHSYMADAANYIEGETIIINTTTAPFEANTWKKVAEIVTSYAVHDCIPGVINFETSAHNGLYFRKGTIFHTGGTNQTYTVNVAETVGTTTIKLYIQANAETRTINGITYNIAAIYVFSPSRITDFRYLKLSTSDVYTSVYAFPISQNYTSGTNQTIFTTEPAGLVEIF